MKVLFVTDLCPITAQEKGLPFTLLSFVKFFKKMNIDVVVLRPNVMPNILIRKRKIYPEGKYFFEGVEFINKNFLTPFFSPSQFKFLENQGYNLILSHMPSGILAANSISKLLKIPYFAAVHSSDIKVLTDFKYFFLRNVLRRAYVESTGVLPRSFWLKDKIEKIIPDVKNKIALIPSGVRISEDMPKKDFKTRPLKIFTAGSFIKRKNISSVIKAVLKTSDVTLKIAGKGPLENKLKALVNGQKSYAVEFLGQITRDKVLYEMEKAQIFILPSYNETFGMVYLEAMSKGCVVVCLKDSGMAGYIKNGENGFLCGGDPDSILSVIEEIKTRADLCKISENAYRTALLMSEDKAGENYLNIIQNIHF